MIETVFSTKWTGLTPYMKIGETVTFQGLGQKDKYQVLKDNDLKLVFKESLRTKTRIITNIPATNTKQQALNIVPSKVRQQRRLIGVKSVEEGDRISRLEGYGLSGFACE